MHRQVSRQTDKKEIVRQTERQVDRHAGKETVRNAGRLAD